MKRNSAFRAGFTLIELMAVVLILAILAGVALPKFFDYQVTAREAACKGALGGVRAGIANFYANRAVTTGTAAYPTIDQLTLVGSTNSVMIEALPDNPYNHGGTPVDFPNRVAAQTNKALAVARTLVSPGTNGWAYFAATQTGDSAIFYANTDVDSSINEFDF